ncbi:DUF262 domain-containing protein [Fictibacillus enclensis]|uniref:DUF262 domain-containing protein n=1 Tax=Fictibacillus enclensis TaxID=1017270 RepID=UPI0024C0E3F8|nr:DUF262 domain-containing protein [Fictibacillus enclensis]WHY72650.1 DUF262 domain-containing protein [Fictibacillus enclensis]
MSGITTFDSTVESLSDLLSSIKELRTQLPDFQRGWVWDDERIKNLLISISLSYPIGSVMMLQTGNPDVRFAPRPVEGITNSNQVEPERLILDGQQRLTSLFQSLILRKPVKTRDSRGKEILRHYYIDIDKIIDPDIDREEAIISVPEDKVVKGPGNVIIADYSDTSKECEAGMLPVSLILHPAELLAWQTQYFSDANKIVERSFKWGKLLSEIFPRFTNYQTPVIMLRKHTPKEAVCQVFENVNTGGVSLTVFELLTASFAADNFELRKNWESQKARLTNTGNVFNKILADISSTDLLQAISLLTTYNRRKQKSTSAVSCKRRDILKLTLDDYVKWGDKVVDGLIEAAKFLQEQHIFSSRDLPYGSQLIPLSAIFVELGNQANDLNVRNKLARWYWSGVLGELYGGGSETRFARDLPEVIEWINGGIEPSTIRDANFAAERLYSLRTRNSAAYKGLHVLLMKAGGKDFISGVPIDIQTYYGDQIDIHHIFPRAYCERNNIDKKLYDSIVNKTPLSYRTNRIIGGNAPSAYLNKIQQQRQITESELNNILRTHLIDIDSIRNDDFDKFFETRRAQLIQIIENVMGKKVI